MLAGWLPERGEVHAQGPGAGGVSTITVAETQVRQACRKDTDDADLVADAVEGEAGLGGNREVGEVGFGQEALGAVAAGGGAGGAGTVAKAITRPQRVQVPFAELPPG